MNNKNTEFKGHALSAGVGSVTSLAAYRLWKHYTDDNINFENPKPDTHKDDDNLNPNTLGSNINEHPFNNNHSNQPDYGSYIPGIEEASTIHGQEGLDIPFDPEVFQFYPDTCAIQSQHLILKNFGIDVTQNELIEIAKENGWYAEGNGTPIEFVGKLLEHYGVDVHATQSNNIFNLSNELAQGHQVIVGVDSGELVNPEKEYGEDEIIGEHADHALVVVGIDTSNPDDVRVIVTDPGTGNKQWSYSEKEFMDAWHDSNCMMVSTEVSPEEFSGSEVHVLDTFAGIPVNELSEIASIDIGASYDFFEEFFNSIMENPEGWHNVIDEYPNLFYTDSDDIIHFVDPCSNNDIPLMEC